MREVASNTEESEAECPKYTLIYGETEINGNAACDLCETWFDLKCANVSKTDISEEYYCSNCV